MKAAAILLALGAAIVAGCTTAPALVQSPTGCDGAGRCVVAGRFSVYNSGLTYTGGELRLDDGRCLPVLVSPSMLRARQYWDGRRAVVSGRAVPRVHEGTGTVSTQYEDRWLVAGLCGEETVLYAEDVWRAAS